MLNFRFFVLAFLVLTAVSGQEVLTTEKAVAVALQNNYDLRLAKNNTEIASLQAGLLNSGYLPTVSATGGINYSDETQSVLFLDETFTSVDGAITESYNASVTAEYVIFDGLVRRFTQKSNEQNLNLQETKEKQQIENTVISVYEAFFNAAYQKHLLDNLQLNVENSKDRLDRSQRKLKYGQGTKLEELNAQVDLNNDSIALVDAKRSLNNLKRNLNVQLGREVVTDFAIDTTVVFRPALEKETMVEKAGQNNIQVRLVKEDVLLSELDIKVNKAQFLPKISGSASYRWNESKNPPTSFALENEAYGVNLGLSLRWNLFDGGNATRVKTAKILKLNREIELTRVKEQVMADVLNAYENYDIAWFTLRTEQKNVTTNELNFSRSERQYGLGQITAIEYRQAQINLLNARNNLARSKYDLKIAELNLLQLGGILLE